MVCTYDVGSLETYEWMIFAPLLAFFRKTIPADARHAD